MPTFHEFASTWLAEREPELMESTITEYRWAICVYLLPFFARMRVDQIDRRAVDAFSRAATRRSPGRCSQLLPEPVCGSARRWR
jgi:integrase